jgi:hypothetical protein
MFGQKGSEVAMNADRKLWLEENAVTCRVFKGKWSIRHCLRMYNDIKELKIEMSSRINGKVTRYESAYNPCEHCKVLTRYVNVPCPSDGQYHPVVEPAYNEAWGASPGA